MQCMISITEMNVQDLDLNLLRVFDADEYIQAMHVTVPAVVPEITIAGVGGVNLRLAHDMCGADTDYNVSE